MEICRHTQKERTEKNKERKKVVQRKSESKRWNKATKQLLTSQGNNCFYSHESERAEKNWDAELIYCYLLTKITLSF